MAEDSTVRRCRTTHPNPAAPSSPLDANGFDGSRAAIMYLDSVKGYRVIVAPDAGQSITAGGVLRCWYQDEVRGWTRNPTLDLSVNTADVGAWAIGFEDFVVSVQSGKVCYVPMGFSTSSGGLTVEIVGWTK